MTCFEKSSNCRVTVESGSTCGTDENFTLFKSIFIKFFLKMKAHKFMHINVADDLDGNADSSLHNDAGDNPDEDLRNLMTQNVKQLLSGFAENPEHS